MVLSQAAAVMADQDRRDHRGRHEDRDHRGDHGQRHGKHHDKHHDKHHGKYKWCARHADVELVDLDAYPRVFWHGKKIKKWILHANLDSKRGCYANIALRDEHGVVARERGYQLRPGRNKIELEPYHKFRFDKREHCFKAFIRLQNKGKWGKWEAARDRRKFCAYEKRAWTLNEGRRDHRRSHRR